MEQVLDALLTGAGMLWKVLWALIFGYIISAGIEVLVTREQMSKVLGERGPKQAALASFFGFVSSSSSLAALAVSRSVLNKGAHPVNALAFLIASTNLVLGLGIVLWVLLGWKFTLGNILLGLVMVAYAYALTRLWFPRGLADQARHHAEQVQKGEGMEMEHGMRSSWRVELFSREGWRRIAHAFFMEWKMVWKEILLGFTIAGFIAVFVPQAFWDAIFIGGGQGGGAQQGVSFLAVLENAAVAPIVAFFTFIGSMGNVPLAAMLWSKGNSFGGVMAFLGADLVAATVIWVHTKYYGWRYALYLSALLYLCMVAAAVTVHYLFAALGAIPTERPSLQEMVRFQIDYVFFLNLACLAVAGLLLWLHLRAGGGQGAPARAHGRTRQGVRG